MSKKYPFPCVSCGLCCRTEACPVALDRVPGAKKGEPCPALLENEDGTTACGYFVVCPSAGQSVLKEVMGIGAGCCIKARCRVAGTRQEIDFASLPAETKIQISRNFPRKQILQKGDKHGPEN